MAPSRHSIQQSQKDLFTLLPPEICHVILEHLDTDDLDYLAHTSKYFYFVTFSKRSRRVHINEETIELFKDGGLLEPLRGSVRDVLCHPRKTITEVRTYIEELKRFPNIRKLTFAYSFPKFMEKNVYTAILQFISNLPFYKNLSHLTFIYWVYYHTDSELETLFRHRLASEDNDYQSLILYELDRSGFIDQKPTLCEKEEEEEDEDEDEDEDEEEEEDEDEDEDEDDGRAYHKRLRRALYPTKQSFYYTTRCEFLSEADKAFLGPFISNSEIEEFARDKIRYPPNLTNLGLQLKGLNMSDVESHNRLLSGDGAPRLPMFYYLPALSLNIDTLTISTDSLLPLKEEGGEEGKEGKLISLPGVKRLELHLYNCFKEAGLGHFHERFPNVTFLKISSSEKNSDHGITYLGESPNLQHIKMEWPQQNFQNMSPNEIEWTVMLPELHKGHLKSLETATFYGSKTGSMDSACEVMLKWDYDGEDWELHWTGDIDTKDYRLNYDSSPYSSGSDYDILGDREEEESVGETSEEETEDSEDESSSESGQELEVTHDELTQKMNDPVSDSDSASDKTSGSVRAADSPEDGGGYERYDEDEVEVHSREYQGDYESGEDVFQVNPDNPYRQAYGDEDGGFVNDTQYSQFDSQGYIDDMERNNGTQDEVAKIEVEVDPKVQETKRIRDLYRR
ncbi:hypothetical protein ABW20_dc0100453 [Dactylellina cionopaga]|nr:hypothetical protein ABW20_dc0100453 [Dactylellina cionopaga]